MTEPYRIVLCEDEPLLLEALHRKIEKSGQPFIMAYGAQNGREALDFLSARPTDLLITDIRMPVMDGMALLHAVTERELCSLSILLSGFSEFEYARSALRLGAFDYLLKPVSQEELNHTLSRARAHLDARRDAELNALKDPADARIDEALMIMRMYIKRHAFEEISLSALSERMNYSAAHLTRLFARKYGEPPQRYQTSLRINEAKRLLIGLKSLSVRQIGEHVGYPDQGYFSRIFRQSTGLSPQQYREEPADEDGKP